jgi:ATP sulfurylase
VNKKCVHNNKVSKKLISGTLIRKLILQNLKIPDIYMRKKISNLLKQSSIIL